MFQVKTESYKEIKTEADLIAFLKLAMAAQEKYILLYALNDVLKAVTEDYFKFDN